MDLFKSMSDVVSTVTALTNKFNIQKKTQTLERKMEDLAGREVDIRTQLDVEEMRPGKKRKVEVENWSKNVKRLRYEVDKVGQNVATSTWLRQLTWAPHLDKLIREVEQLREEGRFLKGLTLDAEETRGCELPPGKPVGEAFQSNQEKIWSYLMSEEVKSIGVLGMGGVGKTTLVTHINNQILNDRVIFKSSCWITVSQDCSIRKLQDAIAKHLNLDWENENDEKIRAGRLWKALSGRKLVFILDDVWDYYPLENVGIPLKKNGCKLIMTSRKKDLCDQMLCDKLVEVLTLPFPEAWCLFRDNLGCGSSLSRDVEKIAKEMVTECAGLPLGIVVLSRIMRGVNGIYKWRITLKELRESKFRVKHMKEEVFTILQFSYECLGDRVLQQCFLHISLYPEDEKVGKKRLIQSFVDSGLIVEETRRLGFDKGNTILEELVKSGLLEEGKEGPIWMWVKMHDLVRDMGIKITTGHSMVKAGQQLREIPSGREWVQSLEEVSLMNNHIKEISPDASPQCPKISTLLLQGNPLASIPKSFFVHMQNLKILNLSRTHIEELPDSFSELENLTTLHLAGCTNLRSVPSLAKMRALKKLNLCNSGIKEIPQGMERLYSLMYLDLDGTKGLEGKQWPVGILPQLLHLQYLDFNFGPKIIKGEELMSLRKLECLRCWFDDVDEFNSCMSYLQIRTPHVDFYEISLGGNWNFSSSSLDCDCKWIKIMGWNMEARGNLFQLPNDMNELHLGDCQGVTSMCQLGRMNFPGLKDCEIDEYRGMKTGIRDSQQCTFLFPELRHLTLLQMRDLQALVSNSLHPSMTFGGGHFFSSLESLRILCCPKIKKLFTLPLLPLLTQLKDITVSTCEELKEIIAFEDDDYIDPILNLPKLSNMFIKDLPQLESVCGANRMMKCDSLHMIYIDRCPKLEKIPIELHIPRCLKEDPVPSALESVTISSVLGSSDIKWSIKRERKSQL